MLDTSFFSWRERLRRGGTDPGPGTARALETEALAALSDRGMGLDRISRLYPAVEPEAIGEALDLERQLRSHVARAA